MRMQLSRRGTLLGALALGTAGAWPLAATARSAAFDERLREVTGGVEPATGRVRLDLPDVAENGEAVPLSVAVDSPMTEADHVSEVVILAEANPRPTVAQFTFTPLSGRAEVTTRIRLGESQRVTAVARMSDGSVHIAQRSVAVTVGGCAG